MTQPRMVPFQIREARNRLELTQADMAEMLGVTKNAVSGFERGEYKAKASVVRLLRAYLSGYRPPDWPQK